jgi:hypothetical protein
MTYIWDLVSPAVDDDHDHDGESKLREFQLPDSFQH